MKMKLEYRTNVCLLAMIIACLRYVICLDLEEIDLLRKNFNEYSFKESPDQQDYGSSVIEKLNTMPHLTPMKVFKPPMLDQLLKGYTFIFGVDDPDRDQNAPDSIMTFENSFLIYRDIDSNERVGRIAMDIREFGWKCGPKTPCTLDELLAKAKPEEIDIGALKSQIASLFIKINGNSKTCYADTYSDGTNVKKALVICFNSQDDFEKLKELFSKLNPKDLKMTTEKIDPNTDQTFTLSFTDGMEAFVNRTLIFKNDGVFEDSKLLFRYQFIEPLDGKKCNVYHNLPIFPIKFLDNNILASKCLLKFKYNQVETFMGTSIPNCEEIIKYIAIKMRNGCLIYINGLANKFSLDAVSRPFEGKWTGWSNYHKILDNGGIISWELFKVEILPEKINIYDNTTTLKESIEYKNIEWMCNDFGECNIWEYMNYLKKSFQNYKINDLELSLKKIKDSWNLQDVNFCFIIDEKDAHIICPRDISEEVNARKALAIATDMKMYDANSNEFAPFFNNRTFFISKVSDSEPYLRDYIIKVKEDKIYMNEANVEGSVFLEYKTLKPLNEIPCGIEFRHISLPIAYHEVNPICCARYLTDENNFICVQNQAKCYITIRRLIQTIRQNCLAKNKIKKIDPSVNAPVSPVNPQKKEDSIKAWSGEVIFNEIDNYRYKGEVDIKKGFLKVTDNEIVIKNNLGEDAFKLDLLTLKFICMSEYQCQPDEYKLSQEVFLEKNYDREWQESTFSKFWATNPSIIQSDCTVLTSEDAEKEVSQMILVCTASKDEGKNLRESITEIYNKKISKISENTEEFNKIPAAHDNSEFDAEVVTSSIDGKQIASSSSATILKVMNDGIIFKGSGSTLFNYIDLVDTKTLKLSMFWNSPLNNAPTGKLKKNINPIACFSVVNIGGLLNICMKQPKRGLYDKASLYQAIKTKAKFLSVTVKRNENKSENSLSGNAPDPFDFGIIPNYKKFSAEFNIDTLSEDTFEIAKNGVWEGWVYEGTLTERNYKKIFTPVFCQIQNGIITFKVDENSSPYKKLKLEEYEQVCYTHCKPDEYILYSNKFKQDVDDNMYLEKTIHNYLGQMKYPYINEACIIMDFMSPIYQYGQQHIICAVDKTQGEKIRMAIENLYYTSLLNLNIEKSVRRPNTYTDRYFGRLIVNDKFNKDFNNFYVDEYGLIGNLVYEKVNSKQRITNNVFNVTYNQIESDNFGTPCAFWYKNLKIKQKSDDMKKLVPDNNCCFRFFTKKDRRKIEICIFNPDNRICIKQARELMKGLKSGCIESSSKGNLPNNIAPGQKEEEFTVYQKNTLDDNENGIFNGYAYFGNAINSSQTPRSNPHFIKIGKDSIDIFDDHLQPKAKYSISVPNILFSCKGQLSCSPSDFLKFSQTHQKYISLVNNINTIFKIFKDTYSLDDKAFQENCFVLETVKVPILICAYMPHQAIIMRKAVSNTFKLKFLRVKLTSVKEPENGKTYKIIFRRGLAETTDEVFLKVDGVYSKNTKNIVFDYRNIDNDAVTSGRCAIWYKSLRSDIENPTASPNPLLMKKDCCFKFFAKGDVYYICSDNQQGICIEDNFLLMKAIFNGCRFSNPNQEQIPPSPDSEILGQLVYQPKIKFDSKREKYDIQALDRINVIFTKDQIKRKYFIDTYNDISFSRRRSLYHGWVNIYPINIGEEAKFNILKYYARITPESFSFFETSKPGAQAKLVIRPDMLSMVCKKAACLPNEYINNFLVKYEPKFAYFRQFFKSKFDFYELGKEDGCSVLENFIEEEAKYYVVCPRFRYHRTMSRSMQPHIDHPGSSFSKNRMMLSATYGKILREIIYNSYLTSRKFVRSDLLSEMKKPVKLAKISLLLKKEEYENVDITNNGVTSNGQEIIKFDDLQTCLVQYNLVYVPEDLYQFAKKTHYNLKKQVCCMRFNGPVSQEYACFGDLNCEYFTYEFAYKFNAKCLAKRKRPDDDVYNELNAGNNVSLKPLIKRLFKEELKVLNIKVFEGAEISTEDNVIKQKSLIIKYMYELRDILHELNKVEISTSQKLNSSPQDTTPSDPISPEISAITPKYKGQSHNKDWEVIASKNRITQYINKNKKSEITIIRDNQYLKTPHFLAIIAETSKYVLMKYNDGNKSHIVEIGSQIKLIDKLSDINEGIYKNIQPALKLLNINLQ